MRVIGAVVALAVIAAGCSSERDSGVAGTAEVPSPTLADEPATTAGSTPRTSPEDPEGAQTVAVSEAGVTFAAPELYTPLVPTELGIDFYESDSFVELAERLQLDADVFGQSLREHLAVFLFAPAQPDGYIDNMSVSTLPGEALPDEGSVARDLDPLEPTDLEIEMVELEGTPAVQASYTRAGADGPLFARDLMFEANGSLVTIGVLAATHADADATAQLATTTVEIEAP